MQGLDGPIPGASLTMEPGNAPWEQPPLYADVQQALAFHLKKLSNPEMLDELLFLLEQKMPLNVLVESLTSYAVMQGYHTIDASQLINPVIHEYILSLADAAGIKVVEDDGPSQEEKDKEKFKRRLSIVLQNEMDDVDSEEIAGSVGLGIEPVDPLPLEERLVVEEEKEKPKRGFISRRES